MFGTMTPPFQDYPLIPRFNQSQNIGSPSNKWGTIFAAALQVDSLVTGALIPELDNAEDIGTASLRYRNLYVAQGVVNSVSAAVAAAGTTLGTATVLTSIENVITSGTALQGVAMSTTLKSGVTTFITNQSTTPVLLYPDIAGNKLVLNGVAQSGGAAISLAVGVGYRVTKIPGGLFEVSSFSATATVNAAVAAAGTNLATATSLTSTESIVTSGTTSQGVSLNPALAVGQSQYVVNNGANYVLLYPDASGNVITYNGTAQSAGAAIALGIGPTYRATKVSATGWEVTSFSLMATLTTTTGTLQFNAVAGLIQTTGSNALAFSTNSLTRWSVGSNGTLASDATNGGNIQFNNTGGAILWNSIAGLIGTTGSVALNLETNSLTRVSLTSGGDISTDVTNGGNILINTIGKGLQVKSGSNAKAGTATANGATTVTVSTTAFGANSTVIFGLKTVGGTILGAPYMFTATPGTSFGFRAGASDTSVYNWVIVDLI